MTASEVSMSTVNTVILTPPIESKNVSSFLWTSGDGRGLGLRLYMERGLTPPKLLSKSGETRVENPVCLICFGDSVDNDAV